MPTAPAVAPAPHAVTVKPTVAALAGVYARCLRLVVPTVLPAVCTRVCRVRAIAAAVPNNFPGITIMANSPKNTVEIKISSSRTPIGLLPTLNWLGLAACGFGSREAPAMRLAAKGANPLLTMSSPVNKSAAPLISLQTANTVWDGPRTLSTVDWSAALDQVWANATIACTVVCDSTVTTATSWMWSRWPLVGPTMTTFTAETLQTMLRVHLGFAKASEI